MIDGRSLSVLSSMDIPPPSKPASGRRRGGGNKSIATSQKLATAASEERMLPEIPKQKLHKDDKNDIRILPERIVFSNYAPGCEYVQKVHICNFSARKQKVLVVPPAIKSPFWIEGRSEYIELSPGLGIPVQVHFACPPSDDKNNNTSVLIDSFAIDLGGKKFVQVPLSAEPSVPSLEFDRELDFGVVLVRKEVKTRDLVLRNVGKRQGSVKLRSKSAGINITPSEFTLDAGRKRTVKIEFNPQEVGEKQTHRISVTLDGSEIPDRCVTLTARVIPHLLSVSINDSPIADSSVRLGDIYYNQVVRIPAVLRNNSAEPVPWMINHTIEQLPNTIDMVTYECTNSTMKLLKNSNQDLNQTAITVEPNEGVLASQQQQTVHFVFSPKPEYSVSQFQASKPVLEPCSYSSPVALQVANHKSESIPFEVAGKAFPLQASLDKRGIDFGEVFRDSTIEKTFMVKNESDALKLRCCIAPIAHFKVSPISCDIPAGEVREFRVVFAPKQMGIFKMALKIALRSSDDIRNVLSREIGQLNVILEGISQERSRPLSAKSGASTSSFVDLNYNYHFCLARTNKHPERIELETHRHKYNDYIHSHREKRLHGIKYAHVAERDPVEEERDYEKFLTASQDSISAADAEFLEGERTLKISEKNMQDLLAKLKDTRVAHTPDSPTAHIQIRDSTLAPGDLAKIFCGSAELAFGNVTIHSQNSMALNFLNTSKCNAQVSVIVESEYGSMISVQPPSSRIVPVNCAGGFTLTLQVHEMESSNIKIHYLINNRYKYTIPVSYEVVPVKLVKDFDEVEFFLDFNYETIKRGHPVSEKTLTLSNPGNYAVGFEWRAVLGQDEEEGGVQASSPLQNGLDEGSFIIEPTTGIIEAKKSITVKATYRPGIKNIIDKVYELIVQDVYDKTSPRLISKFTIPFKGELHQPTCNLVKYSKQTLVDFGVIPVSPQDSSDSSDTPGGALALSKSDQSYITRKVKLKNSGVHPCFFVLNRTEFDGLSFFPTSGMIEGNNGVSEITVRVRATSAGEHENSLVITVLGRGKPIKLPIRYVALLPEIAHKLFWDTTNAIAKTENQPQETQGESQQLKPDQGPQPFTTIIGSWSDFVFELRNTGHISGSMMLDMTLFKDFEVDVRKIRGGANRAQSGALRNGSAGGGSDKTRDATAAADNADTAGSNYPVAVTQQKLMMDDDDEGAQYGKAHIFEILPGEVLHVTITYRPTEIGVINDAIPLRIIGSDKRIDIPVHVQAVESPVEISKMVINFQNKFVHDVADSNTVGHFRGILKDTFEIRNTSAGTVNWYCDTSFIYDDHSRRIFRVDPAGGTLDEGQTTTVTTIFNPQDYGKYETNARLFIETSDSTFPFTLKMKGSGVQPSIAFDPPDIFLPITPSGNETFAVFSIINYGLERTELRYNYHEQLIKALGVLEFYFPEGRLLKGEAERLLVLVRFTPHAKLDTPNWGFNLKVEFSTDAKTSFYVNIRGNGDKSALTLLPFSRAFDIQVFKGPAGENQLSSKKLKRYLEDSRKRTTMNNEIKEFKTPAGVPLNDAMAPQLESFYSDCGETLQRWLDNYISALHAEDGSESKSFPDEFTYAPAKIVNHIVSGLSNRKQTFVATSHLSNIQMSTKLKLQYKDAIEMLNFLKSFGATLNSVQPEFLLSPDLHSKFVDEKIDQLQKDSTYLIPQEFINHLVKTKAYFSIISKECWVLLLTQVIQIFASCGKPTKAVKEAASHGGIFTENEITLFNWATETLRARTGQSREYTCFNMDDISLWAHLLLEHKPSSSALFKEYVFSTPTAEQYDKNFAILDKALSTIFGTDKFRLRKIANGDILETYITLLFLYQNLHTSSSSALSSASSSHRVPIVFYGRLGETMTKHVELTNPTSKSLSYKTKISGPGFSCPAGIMVPPKGQISLPVSFNPTFAKPVQGLLSLQLTSIGLNVTADYTFFLEGDVDIMAPRKKIKAETSLYMSTSVEIDVLNPFADQTTFDIVLKQHRTHKGVKKTFDEANDGSVNLPFIPSASKITIPGRGTALLNVVFLPFETGVYDCAVHFTSAHSGEFIYTLEARAGLPRAVDTTAVWSCKPYGKVEKALWISPTNVLRDKAAASLYTQFGKKPDLPHASQYRVEYSSKYFTGPSEITLKRETKKKNIFSEQNQTELPITFAPRDSGQYSCKILLTGVDCQDVRVYTIQGVAVPEKVPLNLEFQCSPKLTQTHELPITNNSKADYVLKGSIHGNCFSAPANIVVRPGINTIPITFKPLKPGDYAAVYVLSNNNQKHVINLHGVAFDIVKVTCRVGEEASHAFVVKNEREKPANFEVQSDLVETISGAAPFTLGPYEKADRVVGFREPVSGSFRRTLTFTNKLDATVQGYFVEMQVFPPVPSKTFTLAATVRKLISITIPVKNTASKAVEYRVTLGGEEVSGKARFHIDAGAEYLYALTYSPKKVGTESGNILFSSELGEVCYALQLIAKEDTAGLLKP